MRGESATEARRLLEAPNKSIGYPLMFGESRDAVLAALRDRDIEPYAVEVDSIWFVDGAIDLPVHVAYVFEQGVSVTGVVWLFEDASREVFRAVSDLLADEYGGHFEDISTDQAVKHDRVTPDLRVRHVLDHVEGTHSVHFFQLADALTGRSP
jgi:hypothetical protein